MEKEKDAQTEEETAEETRKIQVAYALMFFSFTVHSEFFC
jgi:hypothetical protein